MALNTAGLNLEKNALRAAATHLSLHSADPGTTGTNHTSAARQPAGWSAASGGSIAAGTLGFTGGAANGPVTHVGMWSAADAGVFYGSAPIPTGGTNDLQFNAAGEYTLTSFTVSGT